MSVIRVISAMLWFLYGFIGFVIIIVSTTRGGVIGFIVSTMVIVTIGPKIQNLFK